MALYHTHRPDNFEEMLGNRDVIQSLSTKIEEESLPRAIMFTGPYGCGKTTMGRILAQEVESFGRDFREIDTGDFRGIDTVRDVRRNMKFLPMEKESKHRVYLFDEVHMLGRGGDSSKNEAQNALLKMLEEVPSHAYIILCTTDPQQVLKGVRDRCTKYQMELLSEKDMVKLIKHVADEEGIKVSKEVRSQIVESSGGSPREALQILERISDLDEEKMLDAAKSQANIKNNSHNLCQALIQGKGWKQVSTILADLKGEDPEQVRRHVLSYANTTLLGSGGKKAYQVMSWFEDPVYNNGYPGVCLAAFRCASGMEP